MFRTLTFRLSLAFLLISLIGAVLSALIARQTTLTEFDRLILDRSRSSFISTVSEYYQENQSWDGIEDFLKGLFVKRDSRNKFNVFIDPFSIQRNENFPQSPPNDNNPPRPSLFSLVDKNGIVLTYAPPYIPGEQVDADILNEGIPIEIDGEFVGTVLTTDNLPALDPRDEKYLQRTNLSSFYAAVIAAAIALIVGIFLASSLTSPLRILTNAITAIAKGDLNQKVTIASKDEIGELATAFNQMSSDLAHANHLRRQMTADIAHDLRSPLTVISGYIESIRDGILEPDAERLDIINDEVNHLHRLVDDLRTLSLADANELTLNCQPLSTYDFIERVAMTYRHQAEQQQITIETLIPKDIPSIYIDSERMMQVFGNLIENSLHHTTSSGRILLTAQHQPPDKVVRLQAEDNGEGIPPDALPNIFERFFRADRSRQRNEGESGLGLAIARSIIEAHHGSISVESTLQHGTRFTIELPIFQG